jgi:hypothetical protein
MAQKEEILNELKSVSPFLTGIGNANLYTVPADYFEGLPAQLLNFIQTENLQFGNKTNSFKMPEGFFDHFADTVLEKVKAQQKKDIHAELEDIAPLLNTISKKNIYSVPENYFEKTEANILKPQKQNAKVVSFTIARKWLNYAAAAMVAGILVSSAFLFTDKKSSYDFSNEVNKISDDELQNYIDNNAHTVTLGDETELNSSSKLPEIDEHLQSISDEELQQYLNENGENKQSNKQGS